MKHWKSKHFFLSVLYRALDIFLSRPRQDLFGPNYRIFLNKSWETVSRYLCQHNLSSSTWFQHLCLPLPVRTRFFRRFELADPQRRADIRRPFRTSRRPRPTSPQLCCNPKKQEKKLIFVFDFQTWVRQKSPKSVLEYFLKKRNHVVKKLKILVFANKTGRVFALRKLKTNF